MEIQRRIYWEKWGVQRRPQLTDIPVAKAQLYGRISNDPFDGGRTAAWLAGLGDKATWRAVRDAHTGHTIHVVSDRPFKDLTRDLEFGLKLLGWMGMRPIVWYWWDQEWVRQVPAYEDPGREHVNGGWATPGIREVHVYRREEAHKVMLHECIHALGLDVSHASVEPIRIELEREFGRKLWPHLGEAFTELFAEWLWAIVRGRSVDHARVLWEEQVRCSEGQAAMVWARIHDSKEDENTNVFAYYVLKWVLMLHTEEVLLGPQASVRKWFVWWLQARRILEHMAVAVYYTEGVPMSMGMTCGT
jgi:hypothetical protein